MKSKNQYAIIIAGGQGERFWPLSTKEHPKHLLPLYNKKTLLQNTCENIKKIIFEKNIYIVTSSEHANSVKKQVPFLPRKNIISEPMQRNTAAAIALGLGFIKSINRNASIVVLPADHLIKKITKFHQTLKQGLTYSSKHNELLTIGIKPTFPSTGYGYIKIGKKLEKNICRVNSFVEKPALKKAKSYLKARTYYWNSGMFFFSVTTGLEAFKAHMPKLHCAIEPLVSAYKKSQLKKFKSLYAELDTISIDYGIMEKARNVACIGSTFTWSDVGSWDVLGSLHPKDKNGNANAAPFLPLETKNTFALSETDKIIATIGVENLIIIATDEAILVCNKDKAQDVKRAVAKIKTNKRLKRYR